MKIGVMSDTHGNIDMLQEVIRIMVEDHNVEALIHLGDYFEDMNAVSSGGVEVYTVPGLFEDAWNDPSVPHRKVVELGGTAFLISHTSHRTDHDRRGDPDPMSLKDLSGIDAVLYGHTHQAEARRNDANGMIYICPGHIKAEIDRNMPASFCIIDTADDEISVRFYGIDGEITDSAHFSI